MTSTARETATKPSDVRTVPSGPDGGGEGWEEGLRRLDRADVSGFERDGLAFLAGTTLVGIANYGFVLALAWILPAHQFSELASVNSILLVLMTIANSALPWVVTRAVVRSSPGSPLRRQAVTVTIGVALGCGAVGCLVLVALSVSYASPGVLLTAALIVMLAFVSQAGSGYMQGRRLFVAFGILMVLEAAIKVGAGLLLAVVAGAVGALVGAAGGIGALAGVSLWLARGEIGRSGLPLGSYAWAQIGGIGAVQAGVSTLAMLDVIIGSLLHGASRVMAGYQAMLVFGRVPLFLTGALSTVVYSRLSASPTIATRDWVVRHAARTYRSLAIPLVAVLCTVPAGILLLVLPEEYRSSLGLLIPLSLAGVSCGWVNLVTTCYQSESSYRLPLVVLWGSIPIAAGVELFVGLSVTSLAWTAAVVNSMVAAILVTAAARRYRQSGLVASAAGTAALAGLAALILIPAARVPALWAALAVGLAGLSWACARRHRLAPNGDAADDSQARPLVPAQPVRRFLLKLWALVVLKVRPIVRPATWEALMALRSAAGHGPVVAIPSAVRAVVVAPHPDDETIGCGGTIAILSAAGCAVHVLVASQGEASVAEPTTAKGAAGQQRLAEVMAAARCLGAATLVSCDLPDGQLLRYLEPLTERLSGALVDYRPQVIFVPWPLDDHSDHRAACLALAEALRRSELKSGTEIWTYEVWGALPANRVVDITAVWARKQAALREHRWGRVTFDLDAHLALSRWRSIFAMNGSGHAEAFLALRPADFCRLTEGFEG